MAARHRILISACLMGQKVRYDGQAKEISDTSFALLSRHVDWVAFCPELAGGLPVPRLPAEIEPGAQGVDVLSGRGRVLDSSGGDLTEAFVEGARKTVAFAQAQGCTYAVLTEASPSCGSHVLYSGHHDGARRVGMGVTAQALQAAGIPTFSSDELDGLLAAVTQA